MSNVLVPLSSMSVDDRVAALVQSFLSGKSQRTIDAYRLDLEDFKGFVKAESIDMAARQLFAGTHGDANGVAIAYRSNLIERGFQAATVNRRLASLRSLVRLAQTLGVVPWSLQVPNMKSQAYRDTRGPGRSAFQAMLDAVSGSKPKAIRDRAILRLLHDLALRASELIGLDTSDVDLAAGTIAILGKGDTEKMILSLPDPTKAALASWLEVRGGADGPVFINFDHAGRRERLTRGGLYSIVVKIGRKVGVKTRPHGIRHLSITEACKIAQANGIGLEEVLDHSRHASVSTLMIYRDRERNAQGVIADLVSGSALDATFKK
jgi:integrase/recombinase XerC